jgi:putative acetyltransferase
LRKQSFGVENITIRKIEEGDNPVIAGIIRQTLKEFGAARPGTVYYDDTTDALYQLFTGTPRSAYFIAEKDGKILGGGGIFPTKGLPEDTCELVKMYLLPEARGLGLGRKLIQQSLDFAQQIGFKKVYLETMPELKQALKAYEKLGFVYLDKALGESGHFGCDLWMLKSL